MPSADRLFEGVIGKPLDPDAVARRVTALYGRGGLDTLDYHVVGTDRPLRACDRRTPQLLGPDLHALWPEPAG